MRQLSQFIASCSFLFLTGPLAFGQQMSDEEAAAACLGGCAFYAFMIIAGLVINIAILVWVARDAKSRAMDSSVIWMILVFFTGLIGLLIYILSRPKGELKECSSCGNKRLVASLKCPHCGNF